MVALVLHDARVKTMGDPINDLAKLVEASEPVKEAMPGFVLFVLYLGRSDPFNIFKSRLHKASQERIKL